MHARRSRQPVRPTVLQSMLQHEGAAVKCAARSRPVGPPGVEISSGSYKLCEHNARSLLVLGVRNKQKNRRSRLKDRP